MPYLPRWYTLIILFNYQNFKSAAKHFSTFWHIPNDEKKPVRCEVIRCDLQRCMVCIYQPLTFELPLSRYKYRIPKPLIPRHRELVDLVVYLQVIVLDFETNPPGLLHNNSFSAFNMHQRQNYTATEQCTTSTPLTHRYRIMQHDMTASSPPPKKSLLPWPLSALS